MSRTDIPLRILISTGEVSGDVAGAWLASAVRSRCSEVELFGAGGRRMARAGVRVVVDTNLLGSVGVTAPLFILPGVIRTVLRLRPWVKARKPDLAVVIGHDVFNLALARWLRSHGIRTAAYFPPQVWLWRHFLKPIARSYDAILTSFPAEHEAYERAGGNVFFVGHYLCDLIHPVSKTAKAEARRRLGLDCDCAVVGLLPGSRHHEVRALTPPLLDAALELSTRIPSMQFVLPLAESFFQRLVRELIRKRRLDGRIHLAGDSWDAMRASDLVVAASGTATLEAALLGVPTVLVYRVSALTMLVVKALRLGGWLDSEIIGLPNLLSGRELIPELRQRHAHPREIAAEVSRLLRDSARQAEMREEFQRIGRDLNGEGSQNRLANRILELAMVREGPLRQCVREHGRCARPIRPEEVIWPSTRSAR